MNSRNSLSSVCIEQQDAIITRTIEQTGSYGNRQQESSCGANTSWYANCMLSPVDSLENLLLHCPLHLHERSAVCKLINITDTAALSALIPAQQLSTAYLMPHLRIGDIDSITHKEVWLSGSMMTSRVTHAGKFRPQISPCCLL